MKQNEGGLLILGERIKVNTLPQQRRAGRGNAGTYIADMVLACKHRSVLRPKYE